MPLPITFTLYFIKNPMDRYSVGVKIQLDLILPTQLHRNCQCYSEIIPSERMRDDTIHALKPSFLFVSDMTQVGQNLLRDNSVLKHFVLRN